MCCGHSTTSMGPVRVQVFHSMMNGALTGLDDVGRSVVHVRLFDGGELSFPLSVLVGDGCIQPIEGNMLIFGSTFFQHFAVTFETSRRPYRAGFAPINRMYQMATEPTEMADGVQKMPLRVREIAELYGRQPGQASKSMQRHAPSVVPAIFLLPVGLGTPPQTKELILDTGSYMLAVHCAGIDNVAKQMGEALVPANSTRPHDGFGVLKVGFGVLKVGFPLQLWDSMKAKDGLT